MTPQTPTAKLGYRQAFRDVSKLAFPVILSNLLISLTNVADVFMVGRLGPLELAAVGMATNIRFFVNVSVLMLITGAMALLAQAKGAGDSKRMSFVVRQTFSLMLLFSALLTFVGLLSSEALLNFLNSGGDARAVGLARSYLDILFWGTVCVVAHFTINSLMQAAGDTITPLYLSIAVNVLNILINYLLIFGPGPFPALGVTGAAIGTFVARLLGVAVGLYLIYSGRNVIRVLPGSYLPDWQMFKDIMTIGIPGGLQGVVRNGASFVLVRIATSTSAGTYAAAAMSIGMQVESLAFMPGLGLNIAATSLVGQSLGAWQLEKARMYGNVSILLGAMLMGCIGVLLAVFAGPIVRFFEPSAHPIVQSAGTSYIVINGLFQPLLAVSMIANGALRGAGHTRPGLMANLIGRGFVMLPLAAFLALGLGIGVEGVWIAMVVGFTITASYAFGVWRKGDWAQVALEKSEVYRQHLYHLPSEVRARFLADIKSPLMAFPNAREEVSSDKVIYHLEDRAVEVEIDAQDYHVKPN